MKNLWRLIVLFAPYQKWIILGVIISLVSSLATISLMAVSGWFIATMGLAGVAGLVVNYFTPVAIIRACAILRTGGRYIERLITHEATFRLIAHLRVWFYQSFEKLTSFDIGKSRSGDLMARLRGDIDKLERFYLGFLVPFSVGLLAIFIVTMSFGYFDKKLALLILIYLVICGFVVPILTYKKSKILEKNQVEIESKIKAHLAESLQGMSELLIYDKNKLYQKRLNELNEIYKTNQVKLGSINSLAQNLIVFLSGLALLNILFLAIPLTQNNLLNLADLALLALLTIATFELVIAMPQAFQGLGAVKHASTRIFEITDKKPAITNPKNSSNIANNFLLKFENVFFAYDKSKNSILENINFTLKAGEKLAIMGATGSGKSSIVNLIMRFCNYDKGKITLGNQEIKNFRLEDLRDQFAILPQKPYIFADSIYENLIFANHRASQNDIEKVCKIAGIHDFICGLANGYQTFVGENGSTLSGGQIKRLALARALLKKAPCLILDEMGEGLDYDMELDILQRILENLDNKALIFITHRKAGLKTMNEILYI